MSPAATAATEAVARGDVDGAIRLLEGQRAAIASDAPAQRILGHAHATSSHHGEAIDAYTRALDLDPTLEADPELRADLRTMAANKEPALVAKAFELWLGRTHDPAAKKAIENAAVADDIARRHAVIDVIARYHADEGVDWVAAYGYDLQQETSCEKRRDAVVKLRALNDVRAVPVLQLVSVRQGATGTRNKLVNACLIDAATEAIGYLTGLAGGSGSGTHK
jgi:hypothetical protein